MREIRVRVSRFNPAEDAEPHIEEYTVRVNEGARVLHALHAIHDDLDPTLAYRYCCGAGAWPGWSQPWGWWQAISLLPPPCSSLIPYR